jgi:hypothetical protein
MKQFTPQLCLDAKQQEDLQKIIRSVKVEVRMQFRASIIWRSAMEKQNKNQVARELGTTVKTVRKWRNREIAILSMPLYYRSIKKPACKR